MLEILMLCLLCIIQKFSSNFHLLLILLIEILTAKDFLFLGKKKICYCFVYGFFLHFCVLKKIAFLGIPWRPVVRSRCFHRCGPGFNS